MNEQQKNPQQNISSSQQQHQSPTKQVNLFLCQERLEGRTSPELFRELLPGAWDSHREYIPAKSREGRERHNSRFRTELDPDDVKLVNELGHLSADKLMDYVRTLQTTSLSLGEDEAAQFTRAKLLNILKK